MGMIVLDQQLNEIVVFEPTEYVQLIIVIYHYSIGQTDLSVSLQAVLERSANYDLGRGIGRALLLADDYMVW